MESDKTDHPSILLVDDEQEILSLTRMALESEGIHNVITFEDSRRVLPFLKKKKVSVIVLDLMMPYLNGCELLPILVSDYPDIPVLIMTASDDLETSVECLKMGAFDYLLKPFEPNRLISAINKALMLNCLQNEVASLKECLLSGRLEYSEAFSEVITFSKKLRAICQYAEIIAKSRQPILISGDTGVGKKLMAEAIHKTSGVKGDFVTVNVAGMDDLMFSDTLFGHRKGAFTGADQSREGLIAKAAGGTLFLEEIGGLDPLSQVKLLRLLRAEEYYSLGSDILKHTNARIIAAVNGNHKSLMASGTFRTDLYHCFGNNTIHISPLHKQSKVILPQEEYTTSIPVKSTRRQSSVTPKLPSNHESSKNARASKLSATNTHGNIVDQSMTINRLLKEKKYLESELFRLHDMLPADNDSNNLSETVLVNKLSEIIRPIAHDINAPIATIRVAINDIHNLINSGSSIPDYIIRNIYNNISICNSSIIKLDKCLSDMRYLGRHLDPVFSKVNINTIIEAYLSQLPKNDNYTISLKLCSKLKAVDGDIYSMEQIVRNLISNAIEACTQKAGYITISTKNLSNLSDVQLIVKDNGEGIDPSIKDKIYGLHFTTRKSGFGLGLYLVKKAVELHRGTIKCTSKHNHGTTFFINLPIIRKDSK